MTFSRRRMIAGMSAGLTLGGCQKILEAGPVDALATSLDTFTMRAQRLVVPRTALAREYSLAERSPIFRANGSRTADTPEYRRHLAENFANWRLTVTGLVGNPLSLPLSRLRQMPARTQVTRHDCVEGWSAIGQWTGTPLKLILDLARVAGTARYIVFECADLFGTTPYYESIDLIEAYHPQTILAWRMNGEPLPERHGAPLRLRVERQLGYKHAKFVRGIVATDDLGRFGAGKGGFWEDRAGYQWWAGI
ncbi:molybdopterin-dependent oxidoreductase [Croceicoccus sp. BE223]|uniref:molybdopterin-dependent oxidoreductase n=1 Tax=Croceicoccus sp. BE223 TaxID=2817716 RepID=UPI00285BF7E6|nr:molybdopterin-dependent oxidoreductase [Croceicoccus sp. BE223]MDR7103082.1 DMSO/TMAO reductase YedYZ molybdopterin-dependent catalytic subunit [Croceicoccus sp. BE223]